MHGGRSGPRPDGPLSTAEFRRIFGDRTAGSPHDLVALSRRAKESGQPVPRLLVDCGTEDVLLEDNRLFHRELERMEVSHDYREFAGAHTWDYWDEHVRDALEFHLRALRLHD